MKRLHLNTEALRRIGIVADVTGSDVRLDGEHSERHPPILSLPGFAPRFVKGMP
ncbi:MAG: hypothetical protein H7203_08695 [Rhizobacter sp.]|nr:hypothetical protein [Burkholderiales bacterium]